MNKIELLEYLKEVCERENDTIKATKDTNCYAMGYADGRFNLADELFNLIAEERKEKKK
jgi:hypothetical protein